MHFHKVPNDTNQSFNMLPLSHSIYISLLFIKMCNELMNNCKYIFRFINLLISIIAQSSTWFCCVWRICDTAEFCSQTSTICGPGVKGQDMWPRGKRLMRIGFKSGHIIHFLCLSQYCHYLRLFPFPHVSHRIDLFPGYHEGFSDIRGIIFRGGF